MNLNAVLVEAITKGAGRVTRKPIAALRRDVSELKRQVAELKRLLREAFRTTRPQLPAQVLGLNEPFWAASGISTVYYLLSTAKLRELLFRRTCIFRSTYSVVQ